MDALGGLVLAPITQLTDSEDESQDLPEPEERLNKKRKRRFKPGPTYKERLRDTEICRQFLQKRCGGKCKRSCLKQFQSKHAFEKLLEFRRKWADMHKLDADRLVPRIKLDKGMSASLS